MRELELPRVQQWADCRVECAGAIKGCNGISSSRPRAYIAFAPAKIESSPSWIAAAARTNNAGKARPPANQNRGCRS
jgi:hypothetical protein